MAKTTITCIIIFQILCTIFIISDIKKPPLQTADNIFSTTQRLVSKCYPWDACRPSIEDAEEEGNTDEA